MISDQKTDQKTNNNSITIISVIRFSGLVQYSTSTNPTCMSPAPVNHHITLLLSHIIKY